MITGLFMLVTGKNKKLKTPPGLLPTISLFYLCHTNWTWREILIFIIKSIQWIQKDISRLFYKLLEYLACDFILNCEYSFVSRTSFNEHPNILKKIWRFLSFTFLLWVHPSTLKSLKIHEADNLDRLLEQL